MKTEHTAVTNSKQAVFTPSISPTLSILVAEIVPTVSVCTIILSYRTPLEKRSEDRILNCQGRTTIPCARSSKDPIFSNFSLFSYLDLDAVVLRSSALLDASFHARVAVGCENQITPPFYQWVEEYGRLVELMGSSCLHGDTEG